MFFFLCVFFSISQSHWTHQQSFYFIYLFIIIFFMFYAYIITSRETSWLLLKSSHPAEADWLTPSKSQSVNPKHFFTLWHGTGMQVYSIHIWIWQVLRTLQVEFDMECSWQWHMKKASNSYCEPFHLVRQASLQNEDFTPKVIVLTMTINIYLSFWRLTCLTTFHPTCELKKKIC